MEDSAAPSESPSYLPSQAPSETIKSVPSVFVVVGECRNCPVTASGKYSLFDDGFRRSLSVSFPWMKAGRRLEGNESGLCDCPVGKKPSELQTPTVAKFIEVYNETVMELVEEGKIVDFGGIGQLEDVCNINLEEVKNTYVVGFTGDTNSFSDYLITGAFASTFNSLRMDACSPLVVEVTLATTQEGRDSTVSREQLMAATSQIIIDVSSVQPGPGSIFEDATVFIQKLNENIFERSLDSRIVFVRLYNLSPVESSEIRQFNCSPPVSFVEALFVGFEGRPDLLTAEDKLALETNFQGAYNNLTFNQCDGYFRRIVEAKLIPSRLVSVNSVGDRRLQTFSSVPPDDPSQFQSWPFTNTTSSPSYLPSSLPSQSPFNGVAEMLPSVFIFVGECRGCPITTTGSFSLFDDGFRRSLVFSWKQSPFEYDRGMQENRSDLCSCPGDMKPIGPLAPTKDFFLNVVNKNVLELQEKGLLASIEGVEEVESDQVTCNATVSEFTQNYFVEYNGNIDLVPNVLLEQALSSAYNQLRDQACSPLIGTISRRRRQLADYDKRRLQEANLTKAVFTIVSIQPMPPVNLFSESNEDEFLGLYNDELTAVNVAERAVGVGLYDDLPPQTPKPLSVPPSNTPSSQPSNISSSVPSNMPSGVPSTNPSFIPSSLPTHTPSKLPSSILSGMPSANPSSNPSDLPSTTPSNTPSVAPSHIPSSSLSTAQSSTPSKLPSNIPSATPSFTPSSSPSSGPSVIPSVHPSGAPSLAPSQNPSEFPSFAPSTMSSTSPSSSPSLSPSIIPSFTPSTIPIPSDHPSGAPSLAPSQNPSEFQSLAPSTMSSSSPSSSPSLSPSIIPSFTPTIPIPSDHPSGAPSLAPSQNPSEFPSFAPSTMPSTSPSSSPSLSPSIIPSFTPSTIPSENPSNPPSKPLSVLPSAVPSAISSSTPSNVPSKGSSNIPSASPSALPSSIPSFLPSPIPSAIPSSTPSNVPSTSPSNKPSASSSALPSSGPLAIPSLTASGFPSTSPSITPSVSPSVFPSSNPSTIPSFLPSNAPSTSPSDIPSSSPSVFPSSRPSTAPSLTPSVLSSVSPSTIPSWAPSNVPSSSPSSIPSSSPSVLPTSIPSMTPSDVPSATPSNMPSSSPSLTPSYIPSSSPSATPSVAPSITPSSSPSDACSGAVSLGVGESISGSTIGLKVADVLHCEGTPLPSAPGMWFVVQGTGTVLKAHTCALSDYDDQIAVFAGSCSELTCVAGDNNGGCPGSSFSSSVRWQSQDGAEYYVLVHGYLGSVGDFTLSVEDLGAAPTNVNCDAAIVPPFMDVTYGSTNAVLDVVQVPACANIVISGLDHGLWYKFTHLSEYASVVADTCSEGTNFDTKMMIFSGDCDNLICEEFDDDDDNCLINYLNPIITWDPEPLGIYYVVVFGYYGEYGDFELTFSAPTNLECSTAIEAPLNAVTSGSTGAVNDFLSNSTTCFAIAFGDEWGLWYKLSSIPNDGYYSIEVSTCSELTSFDTQILVFQGDCGESLSCIGGSNNVGDEYRGSIGNCEYDDQSYFSWISEPSITYYVVVLGYEQDWGEYVLTVNAEEVGNLPTNVNCEAAIDATLNGVTLGYTKNLLQTLILPEADPECYSSILVFNETDYGVWYKFSSPGLNYSMVATTCSEGTNFDTQIIVYEGDCGSLICVGSNDDDANECNDILGYSQSLVSWVSEDLVTYYVVVFGFNGDYGDFRLSLYSESTADSCDNAVSLGVPDSFVGSTGSLTFDVVSQCGDTTINSAPGMWFVVEGTGNVLTAHTCESGDYNNQISVYVGTCSSLDCVDGRDDGGCYDTGFYQSSSVKWQSQAASNYYILIHGFGEEVGSFILNVEDLGVVPINVNCDAAIDATANGVTASSTTAVFDFPNPIECNGTDIQDGLQYYGLWYKFTNPDASYYLAKASTCNEGTKFDTQILVYEGGCGALTCVGGNDDDQDQTSDCGGKLQSSFSWLSEPSATYYVLVLGYEDSDGDFLLTILYTPPQTGDICDDAIALGVPDSFAGSTSAMTLDDVDHCGDTWLPSAPGMWFLVQGTGNVFSANTCESKNYDNQISVFVGSCSTLTCLSGRDETGCPGDDSDWWMLSTSVKWQSQGGLDYYILVHGYEDEVGSFTLNVDDLGVAPTNVNCDAAIDATFTLPEPASTTAVYDFLSPVECNGTNIDDGYQHYGLWYKLTNDDVIDYSMEASTCNDQTNFDTQILVYEGDCGDLACVGGNDDDEGCSDVAKSRFSWLASPSVTYYVVVLGYHSDDGDFHLEFFNTALNLDASSGAVSSVYNMTANFTPAITGATISPMQNNTSTMPSLPTRTANFSTFETPPIEGIAKSPAADSEPTTSSLTSNSSYHRTFIPTFSFTFSFATDTSVVPATSLTVAETTVPRTAQPTTQESTTESPIVADGDEHGGGTANGDIQGGGGTTGGGQGGETGDSQGGIGASGGEQGGGGANDGDQGDQGGGGPESAATQKITTKSPNITETTAPTTIGSATTQPTIHEPITESRFVETTTPTTIVPRTIMPTAEVSTPESYNLAETATPTSLAPTITQPTPRETTTESPAVAETTPPTTIIPATTQPTSQERTNGSPTAAETTTPTTIGPTTTQPTMQEPTTESPTVPATITPTTIVPKTTQPTTQSPTTEPPAVAETTPPTTIVPPTTQLTSQERIDWSPTAAETTTPTTIGPTTTQPATQEPTTESPTVPATITPTTIVPKTTQPTTQSPTTESPAVAEPANPTTVGPTTQPTTQEPTSESPIVAQTTSPTTLVPTTSKPTTNEPTTESPTVAETINPTTI